ncbi:unnamed protein product [Paramecium primaurelia]|uniref:Uncharacterized protein n=2 Tax=Paramecium TaxID=5884 RepID=A0A8S1U1B8_9CILI|nr:unnamed protein product [Paramecium primaurelia]CAD8157407.1 unnamed protein product [Paramecium pentaurelia]
MMKQHKKIRKSNRRVIQVIQIIKEDYLDSWVNTNEYLLSKLNIPTSLNSQAPGSMLEILLGM